MKIIQKPSPNFTRPDTQRDIWAIIIHATATKGLSSPLEWLTLSASKVSAHYLIDLNGEIYQMVNESDIAWHAGKSKWRGKEGVNSFSVGIELVNANDGVQLYPQEQLDSCADIVADISKRKDIHACDVIGHSDIAPGRKNDPVKFPWGEFRGILAIRGVQA